MNEGIIRQTIREFIEHYQDVEINRMRLEFLEQKLIEKIKEMYKECENIKQYNCEDGAFVEGIFYTYDKLLGDNQE